MRQSAFPTSFAQLRLYFLAKLEPRTAVKNPCAFRIIVPLDIKVLRRALQTVVQRHALLCTVCDSVNSECQQVLEVSHAPIQGHEHTNVDIGRDDLRSKLVFCGESPKGKNLPRKGVADAVDSVERCLA
jgi:hypothetical protein